ncbi:ATP-binding protein [Roseococcus sp. YIM B11640]|uniref:ATP-binding protein n=1 Tax=Roseococcus sp. YIM B11640 TaxID=3133973 RepID=UPI003C7C9512
MTRWRPRLWPKGLAGRTILVLVAGLLALHVGSVWIHEASLRGSHRVAREDAIAEGLERARRALSLLPVDRREAAARALSGPGLDLRWHQGPAGLEDAPEPPSLQLVRQWLLRTSPELDGIRIAWGDGDRHHLLVGTLPVDQAGSLSFSAPVFLLTDHEPLFDPEGFAWLAAIALAIGVAFIFVVRSLTRPLRELSAAADRWGRDAQMTRVAEEGPTEIRQAARAFNAMQERIRRLIEDRTQALAAVSHDLRTPITRMRLIAGFLDDTQARDRIDASLDEMAAMIETTLDYLRGAHESEAQRATDLASILQTISDEAADAGHDVAYEGPSSLVLQLRPVTMRRAVSNLVNNGIAYGETVQISLREDRGGVRIEVADSGPGLPEAELERAFEPFRRIEESRNRATGGVGLGLTIARRAVEAEGGSLHLANRPSGGLSAHLFLPRNL